MRHKIVWVLFEYQMAEKQRHLLFSHSVSVVNRTVNCRTAPVVLSCAWSERSFVKCSVLLVKVSALVQLDCELCTYIRLPINLIYWYSPATSNTSNLSVTFTSLHFTSHSHTSHYTTIQTQNPNVNNAEAHSVQLSPLVNIPVFSLDVRWTWRRKGLESGWIMREHSG
jgi:hypothetical protein